MTRPHPEPCVMTPERESGLRERIAAAEARMKSGAWCSADFFGHEMRDAFALVDSIRSTLVEREAEVAQWREGKHRSDEDFTHANTERFNEKARADLAEQQLAAMRALGDAVAKTGCAHVRAIAKLRAALAAEAERQP